MTLHLLNQSKAVAKTCLLTCLINMILFWMIVNGEHDVDGVKSCYRALIYNKCILIRV